ncbi:MAG: precorrin-2 C(20)-methyltransferase [Rhodospirillales bacterium]
MSAEGKLWGVGVGPGAADLITLRAVRVLAAAPVIAYPAAQGVESLARAIAAPHIPEGRIEIIIETPMTPGNFPAHHVYDDAAADISAHLSAGRDAAVLCEGDPFLYGSFMYLFARLAARHRVEVIPGVSSLGACAAAAGAPLVSRNEVLTVVPAPAPDARLDAALAESEALAVMKVGRHLPRVRGRIEAAGRLAEAWYVERAAMESQRVLRLADVNGADAAPYFSMILVRRPNELSNEMRAAP